MKTYAFTVKCVGYGETLEEAWEQAKDTLQQELRKLEPDDASPELIEDDVDPSEDDK